MTTDFMHKLTATKHRVYLPELLKEVSKEKDRATKVFMLRAYANRGREYLDLMKAFVLYTFHPDYSCAIPDTEPPYKKGVYKDFGTAPGTMFTCIKRMGYWAVANVNGEQRKFENFIQNQIKRESVFIQTLESMCDVESELFLMMTQKKILAKKYPTIKYDLLKEAFSGWLPDPKSLTANSGASE